MILVSRSGLLAAAFAVAVSTGTAADASAATPVVPPGGKIAGHGYGQWLRINWQRAAAGKRLRPV